MEEIMSKVLFGLIHLLVIGSIVAMIVFIVRVIMEGYSGVEQLLRSAAAAAGLLIYLGARAYGISIPDLMASSIRISEPILRALIGVAAPFASGALVALFCIKAMRRHSDIGARGVVLLSALVFAMFADTYAALALEATPDSLELALPNITFVLGMILYSIFGYR